MSFDFRDEQSPCYGCVFPQTEEQTALNCDNAGVLSRYWGYGQHAKFIGYQYIAWP